MPREGFCNGCDHSLGSHYQGMDGKVHCLVHGQSTHGVIGLPWDCDCVDYQSESTKAAREQKAREDEAWQKQMDEAFAPILKEMKHA